MAGSQSGELKMEGWLYIIRSNLIGLQYSRKRYFVLEDHLLNSFKSTPVSNLQEPGRSAIIDSSIRVTDNGRESIHRKVFFIFTLYNSSNHNDQLKLGASSPEEAARWIHSFKEAALKGGPYPANDVACSKSRWQSFRDSTSKIQVVTLVCVPTSLRGRVVIYAYIVCIRLFSQELHVGASCEAILIFQLMHQSSRVYHKLKASKYSQTVNGRGRLEASKYGKGS